MSLLNLVNGIAGMDASAVTYDQEYCLHAHDKASACEACFEICPVQAIQPGQPPHLDAEKCQGCLACLPVCPTGAYRADDLVKNILSCVARQEITQVDLVCSLNPQAELGLVGHSGIQVHGCLAGLGAGTLTGLAALGCEQIDLRMEACAECPWSSLAAQIEAQAAEAQQLLAHWGKSQTVRLVKSLEKPQARKLFSAKDPPISRRDLFHMTVQGRAALARSIENGEVSDERQPGRNRIRQLAAAQVMGEAIQMDQSLPEGGNFAALFASQACTACGVCERACPTGSLILRADEAKTRFQLVFYAQYCVACGYCLRACAPNALTMEGQPPLSRFLVLCNRCFCKMVPCAVVIAAARLSRPKRTRNCAQPAVIANRILLVLCCRPVLNRLFPLVRKNRMILPVTNETISEINNPDFRAYAEKYVHIYQNFMEQVRQTGIEIAEAEPDSNYAQRVKDLAASGAQVRNDAKSLVVNRISPGCAACQTSLGSVTYFLSLKCHRDCFFCFNPNQENYDYYRTHTLDLQAELHKLKSSGQIVHTLALTGGEPLLFKTEAVQFFQTAHELFPRADLRLYTCGDHVDEEILQQLKDAGLNEMRFSIRLYDLEKGRQHTLDRIALALKFIPRVMVEMPVMPGSLEEMQTILQKLDALGVYGINLLELCFPLANVEEFKSRGYKVKARPFRVLYDYWYAGGLPISGSETVCLDLIAYTLQAGLKMGVHYCSLENKHTGQVYRQNKTLSAPRMTEFSEKDYFLKSAKVFGADMDEAAKVFAQKGFDKYEIHEDQGYLEFPVKRIKMLKKTDLEIAISTNILEVRNGETVLRELGLERTTAYLFDYERDI